MKKFTCLWIFIVIIISAAVSSASVMAAAELPKKGETQVQDKAGMLPSAQMAQLEKTAKGKPYLFFILTVNSLDGQNAETYIKNVYQSWNLRADDILILISKGERIIKVYFSNAELDKKLNALPSDYAGSDYKGRPPLDQLIGKHFTPYGKKDDYVQGLTKLMEAFQSLPAPSGQTKAAASAPAASGSAAPGKAAPAPSSGSSAVGVLIVLLLLAAFIVILIVRIVTHSKQKTLRAELIRSAEEVSALLLRSSEKLQPLVQLYESPQALKTIRPVNEELGSMSGTIQTLIDDLKNVPLSFIDWSGKGKRALNSLGERLDDHEERMNALGGKIDELVEMEQSNSRIVRETRHAAEALKEKADEASRSQSTPLPKLLTDIDEMLAVIGKTHQKQLTDLINAAEELAPIQSAISLYDGLLDRLAELVRKQNEYPDLIRKVRTQVESAMSENGLKPVEIDPFGELERADGLVPVMKQYMEDGDLKEVAAAECSIDTILANCKNKVEQYAALKNELEQGIRNMEDMLEQFGLTENTYREVLQRMQTEFDSSVWSFLPDAYAEAIKIVNGIKEKMPALKISFADQTFSQTEIELRRLLELYDTANSKAARCMESYELATNRFVELRDEVNRAWNAYHEAVTFASSRNIPVHSFKTGNLSALASDIESHKSKLNYMFTSPPYHLERIVSEKGIFIGNVEALSESIHRLAKEKERAEEQLRQLNARFDSAYSRARTKGIAGSHVHNYQSNMGAVQNLISMGLYADAIARITQAESAVNQMQSEYDDFIREEARQEELRRQQEEELRRTGSGGSESGTVGGDSFGSDSSSASNSDSGTSGNDTF